ncbi:hypothetical protein NP493_3871g00003 [Ridgeia piscesae]|uniref:Uncharacterized protein n=1 Tax=Ridgeia piscesae TaxID=27915 RepID=A0AAD9J3J2_RIDPI|nr:hypothetical protein NP493_3871g00003 [Ridgeia piscesae]
MSAQIANVTFWDWGDIFTRPALFSVDGLHPSREGNTLLHATTASRVLQLLSHDSRVARATEAAMVAAELSRTRADHRQRMEAKTRTKASRILQPSNYQQETAPVRVYGNYSPPGRGHPSGPAVDMSELENQVIMNVAGVYIALHPGLLHPCCTVCVVN